MVQILFVCFLFFFSFSVVVLASSLLPGDVKILLVAHCKPELSIELMGLLRGVWVVARPS